MSVRASYGIPEGESIYGELPFQRPGRRWRAVRGKLRRRCQEAEEKGGRGESDWKR
jgi:hypothetical protein